MSDSERPHWEKRLSIMGDRIQGVVPDYQDFLDSSLPGLKAPCWTSWGD
jgi:hypothetical protein